MATKFSKTNLLKYEVVQFLKSTILSGGSNTYVGIGRPLYWGDSSTSETAVEVDNVILSTEYINEVRRNTMAVKKVEQADTSLVVPRSDWVSGLAYQQYNDHIEMFSHEGLTSVGTCFANANTTIVGTVNSAISSASVVGSGTQFTRFLIVGDQISINSQTKTVSTITSDTLLTTNSNFTKSGNGNTTILISNNRIFRNTAGLLTGNIDVGSIITLGTDTREVVEVKSSYAAMTNTKFSYAHTGSETLLKITNKYPLYANNFYVRNSRDQVFKCLYTPEISGVPVVSTVEPTIDIDGQLPEDPYIETGDMYKWKYLYTIPYGLKQKFFTNTWMPVVSENSVTNSSTDGRIDIIEVLSGGSGYYLNGQSGNTPSYAIVTITGDGTDASVTAQIGSGIITELNILNGGSNYTKATVSVSDPYQLGTGTPASFDVVISPQGGHGSNPAKELGCYTLMISVELNSTEGGKIPISGAAYGGDFDFRQISLIRDPTYANGVFASDSTYITSYQFDISDPGSSDFSNDETVYIGPSFIDATFTATVASFDVSTNKLYLINLDGSYSDATGSEIKGASSATSGAILTITDSEIDIYSGDTLYVENRLPVIRNINQTEQIRLIVSF